MSILNTFKNGAVKISLDNKQDVYFQLPNKSEWQSGTVSWVKNNVFYSVEFTGNDLNADEVKQTLLYLVNQKQ
ncbi:hypothetical protein DS745_02470 [Anaerobacillus alkaliphilus]|uniref:DUF4367 domain-containing protein n=1 Tax=Anaerobacillus alkaliphilus TaxID=1548597 RepID=A0A4Q0VYW5_9BACI|nr:hypothetical protein [Anaerobacillus alkaliphilus]RXJ04268.1 hypothetical protein DS745_02470 [Anaerobacillus alkaliphilus]